MIKITKAPMEIGACFILDINSNLLLCFYFWSSFCSLDHYLPFVIHTTFMPMSMVINMQSACSFTSTQLRSFRLIMRSSLSLSRLGVSPLRIWHNKSFYLFFKSFNASQIGLSNLVSKFCNF